MKKYTVVTRPDEVSLSIAQRLRSDLNEKGYSEDERLPEVVFVIGGDGTFLYAVHKYLEQLNTVLFYGIHTGTLGFYTDYQDTDYDEFIGNFLAGKVRETSYPVLQADTTMGTYYAVNEIRVENPARTQVVDVTINGQKFEKIRGTGFLVCTQLGSTAYCRALGGAVLQEGLDLIEMCEIAGIHHNKFRSLGAPIVMFIDSVLEFDSESYKGAVLGADSDVFRIDAINKVTVRVCPDKQVRTLRGRNVSYFSRLKSLF